MDGINFEVLEHIIYRDKKGRLFRTLIGLISDSGSIPTIFQNIISSRGKLLRGFVLHDGLYKDMIEIQLPDGTWVKYTADENESNSLLLEVSESLGGSELECHTIHGMLQLFGWKAFSDDRKKLINPVSQE